MDLLSDDVRRDPVALYSELRREGPVFRVPGSEMWMFFDHGDVARALADCETFSSRMRSPAGVKLDWLIFQDPPQHGRLRSIVSRVFSRQAMMAFEKRIRVLSRAILDDLLPRGQFDLATDYASKLPLMLIAEIMGLAATDHERIRGWTRAIIGLSEVIGGVDESARVVVAYETALNQMKEEMCALVAQRRERPGNDVLSRLANAGTDGGRLDDDELLGFFQLLLTGGSETVSNLIGNAVLCFAECPAELARVREDRGLLPSAIEEVLRFRSPGQVVFRETRRQVDLHGERIPAGSVVLLVIGAANRDESRFVAPHRFDVGRTPNPHVAFGHGVHACLGAALARMEARIALEDLLSMTTDVEVLEAGRWKPRQGIVSHGPETLPIRVILDG